MFAKTLSDNAQNALALLGQKNCLPIRTYLAGGSALALHFGHRISVDFDFFTPISFDSDEIAKRLATIGDFSLQQKEDGTLLGIFNKVKFSLFIYDYPLVDPTIVFSMIKLASTRDIGAMKLAAIMDRGTKKDFIDVYFLIKNGFSFDELFKAYDKKYKALANNLYSIITSLSYFEDAEKTDMPEMIIETSWRDVKEFFKKEVKRLADVYLK